MYVGDMPLFWCTFLLRKLGWNLINFFITFVLSGPKWNHLATIAVTAAFQLLTHPDPYGNSVFGKTFWIFKILWNIVESSRIKQNHVELWRIMQIKQSLKECNKIFRNILKCCKGLWDHRGSFEILQNLQNLAKSSRIL